MDYQVASCFDSPLHKDKVFVLNWQVQQMLSGGLLPGPFENRPGKILSLILSMLNHPGASLRNSRLYLECPHTSKTAGWFGSVYSNTRI